MIRINLQHYPHLLKEWDKDNADDFTSLKKSGLYSWVCPKNHKYTLTLSYRTDRGLKCPYCSGKRVLPGFNDIATTDPWAIDLFSKNSPIQPTDVSRSSKKKAIFVCQQGHEHEQIIKNAVVLKRGCAYCSGHIKKRGVNDLVTLFPEIAQEYSSNNVVPVNDIWGFSRPEYKIEVEWTCRKDKAHVWRSSLNDRIKNKKTDACPYCRGILPIQGNNDLETLFPLLQQEWSSKNSKRLSSFSPQSCYKALWECDKGHEWSAYIFHRTTGTGNCPRCCQESLQESQMYDFLTQFFHDEDIVVKDRKILCGKELDFYIPQKKLAIEMNGIYWHSEARGTKERYHYEKWKNCRDHGIQLITIWEDEWAYKQEIVKSMLLSKLGLNTQEKIPARKTKFVKISSQEAQIFSQQHHIQGASHGKFNYALKHDKDIVAVMILTAQQKDPETLVLHRFCSSTIVQGGFSKCMKNILSEHKNVKKIITFSDNCYSNGNLYNKNGFIRDKDLAPDYKYIYRMKRFHKFNFRKNRFKKDANLIFDDSLSEKELAALNNIHRIWDCGKIRWVFIR